MLDCEQKAIILSSAINQQRNRQILSVFNKPFYLLKVVKIRFLKISAFKFQMLSTLYYNYTIYITGEQMSVNDTMTLKITLIFLFCCRAQNFITLCLSGYTQGVIVSRLPAVAQHFKKVAVQLTKDTKPARFFKIQPSQRENKVKTVRFLYQNITILKMIPRFLRNKNDFGLNQCPISTKLLKTLINPPIFLQDMHQLEVNGLCFQKPVSTQGTRQLSSIQRTDLVSTAAIPTTLSP